MNGGGGCIVTVIHNASWNTVMTIQVVLFLERFLLSLFFNIEVFQIKFS